MTREHKLALIIGFAVVLLVGVLVSDHFSQARRDVAGLDLTPGQPSSFGAAAPVLVATHTQVGHGSSFDAGVDGRRQSDERGADAGGRRTASEVLSGHQAREFVMIPGSSVVSDPSDAFAGGWSPSRPAAGARADAPPRGDLPRRDAPGASAGDEGLRTPGAGASITPAPDPLAGGRSTPGATPIAPPDHPTTVRRHSVQPGETLSKIAKRYYGRESAWRDIAAANPGRVDEDGNVRSGVTLVIPSLGVPPGGETTPANGGGPAGSPKKPSDAGGGAGSNAKPSALARRPGGVGDVRFHVVQRGEVLGTISQNLLGTSRRYSEIVALNADVIDDPDHVPAGTRLRIPPR